MHSNLLDHRQNKTTTNNNKQHTMYHDNEPDYDEMIEEDQQRCITDPIESEDNAHHHLSADYIAGDRAGKKCQKFELGVDGGPPRQTYYDDEPDYEEMIEEDQQECTTGMIQPELDDKAHEHTNDNETQLCMHSRGPECTECTTIHTEWERRGDGVLIPGENETNNEPERDGACMVADVLEPPVESRETGDAASIGGNSHEVGEANYASGSRVDLFKYPTIHVRNIPSEIKYVTHLESSEQAGFYQALRSSGGFLAIRAQIGMGKTTALELTLREMLESGEVEFVIFIGCRITQISDLQQQFSGLGKVETYHKLMDEKRYWRPDEDSPAQVTTIDSLHRYSNFPFDKAIVICDEARSNIGAICDPSKNKAEIDRSRIVLSSALRGAKCCVLMDNDILYDGMCPHFMANVDRARQWTLLNFEHRSERMKRKFKLTANQKQWEEQISNSIKAGRNMFVACASQVMAKKVAEFCEQCHVSYKLYTGDKGCEKDKKADFMDIDRALKGIQVVIATTCVTVAVDIKEWHCDEACVYSMSGGACGKIRELFQCVGRCGRKGVGDGPGQISNPEISILCVNPFKKGKINEKLKTESTQLADANERYDCHLRGIKLQEKTKRAKVEHQDSGFSSTDQARLGVTASKQTIDDLPWLLGCRAWGQVEDDENKDDDSYLWWMIAAQNGYQVTIAEDPTKEDCKKSIGFGNTKFGYMELSSGPTSTFPDIDNATKLIKKPSDKYNIALNKLIDFHDLDSEPLGNLAAEFTEQTGRLKNSPSEVVNEICELTYNAFNIRDNGLISGEEYELYKGHLAAFWNQHNARTRSREEMMVKDAKSGNELLVSQRLRRDEFDTLTETCRLLSVSWRSIFDSSDGTFLDETKFPLFEVPLKTDPRNALFAEQDKHPELFDLAKQLYEILLTYATYRNRRQKMTEKQTTLNDKNHTPIKQGLDLLFNDFGVNVSVKKTHVHKRSKAGGDVQRRRCEEVCLVNSMHGLINKSLVSIADDQKVPFHELEKYKEDLNGEISIEPSATVHQEALEIDDVERVRINHNGPKHLLPSVYKELVDVNALDPAITKQRSIIEDLKPRVVTNWDSHSRPFMNQLEEDLKKAEQRLEQLEHAKQKGQSTMPVQYYYGKMGFGRRYAYTKGSFSYQGASRQVRKILAERFYHDIDIVNCYPVLLWHLLSKMTEDVQEKFPTLHTAAFKRNQMIEAIMAAFQCERDTAKRLPSVLMNGGSIHGTKGWCAKNGLNSQHAESTIVDKLYEECQEAIALFAEQFPDHKEKSKRVFPKKLLNQHNVAPIHFELELLEDKCITSIEKTAREEGWQIDSLMFDGGLLRRKRGFGSAEVDALLLRMQRDVKAHVGVDIKIAVKPF